MPDLKTNYLDPEWEGDKAYVITEYPDTSVSFTDVTVYIKTGDYIMAQDINTTNAAINAFANLYKSWIGGSYTALKTNYVDAEWDGRKKFSKTENQDGTVTLQDITTYTVQGDTYNAAAINAANTLINSFTNGYDNGITSIKNKLASLGATSSDILTAIDQMASVQNTNGINQGITDVTSAPNSYHLYTAAQYETQVEENEQIVTDIRAVTSQLATYSSSGSWASSFPWTSYGGSVSNILPNMTAAYASEVKQIIVQDSKSLENAINGELYTASSAFSFLASELGDI